LAGPNVQPVQLVSDPPERLAAREALKYAVKPSDMIADAVWLLELTRQLDKLRFIASGGVLKDILGERDKETNENLLLRENSEGESSEAGRLFFDWRRRSQRYRRRRLAGVD
jgi:hypothetical protein